MVKQEDKDRQMESGQMDELRRQRDIQIMRATCLGGQEWADGIRMDGWMNKGDRMTYFMSMKIRIERWNQYRWMKKGDRMTQLEMGEV